MVGLSFKQMEMTMPSSKTTARTKKSKAKGIDDSVDRNVEGVALPVVSKKYQAGNTQIGERDITGFHRFTLIQLQFLKEYSKDCDIARAANACGANVRTVKDQWLHLPAFKAEIEEIHDVWRLNIKMTAETAAAKHIMLMNKLDKDYDRMTDDQKTKMANALVKGSETYLRASGHFQQGGGETESQVVINIDLGNKEVEVKKGKEVARVKPIEDDG